MLNHFQESCEKKKTGTHQQQEQVEDIDEQEQELQDLK